MGEYRKYLIELTEDAKEHLQLHKKSGDKATLNKISKLFHELAEHPYTGTGQPEQLKYNLKGFWSRRINRKNRLIYAVHEEIVTVEIITAMGHYSNK